MTVSSLQVCACLRGKCFSKLRKTSRSSVTLHMIPLHYIYSYIQSSCLEVKVTGKLLETNNSSSLPEPILHSNSATLSACTLQVCSRLGMHTSQVDIVIGKIHLKYFKMISNNHSKSSRKYHNFVSEIRAPPRCETGEPNGDPVLFSSSCTMLSDAACFHASSSAGLMNLVACCVLDQL